MNKQRKQIRRGCVQAAGGGRGRSRRISGRLAGGASATVAAVGTALHLCGMAAIVVITIWGSAIVLVILWLVTVLVWNYVYGDETRSGRVERLPDLILGRQGAAVPLPARVQAPFDDAHAGWPGLSISGQHPVRSRVLDTARRNPVGAGQRPVRARTRPAVPRQRSGPGHRSPRTTVTRCQAPAGRCR
jgi:hypothetical protein